MNEQDEEYEAPVLTDEGAALLAKAVARHKKTSGRHDRRRHKDALRNDPASSEDAFDADDAQDLPFEDPLVESFDDDDLDVAEDLVSEDSVDDDVVDADDAEDLAVDDVVEDSFDVDDSEELALEDPGEDVSDPDDAEDLVLEDPLEDSFDADDFEDRDLEDLVEDDQIEEADPAEAEFDADPVDVPDPEPKKPVRSRPVDITTAGHRATLQPDVKNETPTSRTLVALGFMMLAGLFLIGFAAWSTFSDDVVESEVAGVVEEAEDPAVEEADDPAGAVDGEPPAADDPVAEEASSQETVDDESVDVEPPEPAPAAVDPEALSFTIGEGVGLSVYDVDPVNQGTRSFAIRISNASDELIPSTAGFEIQVLAASGERIPAMVRFVHQEIPSGSSAIATVRVEGVPKGPTTAVLVFAGNDVDEQALP